MIKSILELTREEVENLGTIGFNKSSGFHHDICKALAEGKKQEEIAENLNIDDRLIRKIKHKKCPECGFHKGRPAKV